MNDLWTRAYFDTVYLHRWPLGPPDETVFRQVDFLMRQLNAAPGSPLIEVGCGQGRFSLGFAARGLRVTGLDASETLLIEARRLAGEARTSMNWVRGDMRKLPPNDLYDCGVLLDAYGFFESDDEKEEAIRQLRQANVPGGRLVIAVVNGSRILNNLEPIGREQRDGCVVEIRRALEADRRILREEVIVTEKGCRYAAERRQRLYSVTEIKDIIVRNGLQCSALYGDMLGNPFSEDASWKIVMVCERFEA